MPRPKSYRVITKTCENCSHVFVKHDYEESEQYYCTKGSKKRPRCMSVAMGEVPTLLDGLDSYTRSIKKWDKWADPRQVKCNGVCDEWEEINEENPRKN